MIALGVRALIAGQSAPLVFQATDLAGNPVAGSVTVVAQIKRLSGATPWWNGATWVALKPANNTMAEIADMTAAYQEDWTPDIAGWYLAECWDTTPGNNVVLRQALFLALTAELGPSVATITVREDPAHTPISGATVWVLDSTKAYTAGMGTTNGAGVAALSLSDGSYWVRVVTAGYTFAETALVVSGATALTIDGTPFTAHPNPIVVIVAGAVGSVAASAPVDLVQFMESIPLEGHLTERDGTTVVDLTTATSVRFAMWKEGATTLTAAGACTVTDAANGEVQYAWAAGELDVAGHYHGQFVVLWPGGEEEAFPARRPFELHIRESIEQAVP